MTTPHISNNYFLKRSGTTNKGNKYEDILIAHLAYQLSVNNAVNDFTLSSNDKDFELFDDIVLDISHENGNQMQYAIQLKHKPSSKTITKDMLEASKGDFSVQEYFQSFLEIKRKQKFHSAIKCVLCTNANFTVTSGKYTFRLKDENVIGAINKCILSADESFLDTSRKNCVYKFKLESEDPELREFSDHFYLYTNQKSYDELQVFFESLSCDKYLNYINKWSEKEGKKQRLSKSGVKSKLAEFLLKPYIKSSGCVSYSGANLFHDISAFYDIINISENINLYEFYNVPRNVKDLSGLDLVDLALFLWHSNISPLVVEVDESNSHIVYKAINFFEEKERNFVLCGQIDRTQLSKFKIFCSLDDLTSKSDIYNRICQNTEISFQGRDKILLADILKSEKKFSCCITSDVLLTSRMIKIGEKKEDLPVPYIEQFLPKNSISFAFFNDPKIQSVSVVNCNGRFGEITTQLKTENTIKIEEFLQKDESLHKRFVIIAETECTNKQFEEICKKCRYKTCHLFTFNMKQRLEWVRSNGNIAELRTFVEAKDLLQESEIFSSNDHKINIISAKPGAGKTVLLQYLKNTIPSKYWVVKINLRDHFSHFLNQDVDSGNFLEYLLRFQADYFNYDLLTLKVRKVFEEDKRIVFLFDALDELPVHTDRVIYKIYEQLAKRGFTCWITTRDHLQQFLEDTFGIFSFTIKEMDTKQQQFYIERHLKTKHTPEEVQVLIKKIIDTITLTKDTGFLGIPLRMYMLTNLFLQDPEKYKQLLNNRFTLTDLIHHFVKGKFRFCYEDKGTFVMNQFTKKILKRDRKNRTFQYEILALKTFLPVEILSELNINYTKVLHDIKKEDKDDFGIVTKINLENDVASFVHNVFGEYFVASWMVKNIDYMKKLKDIIFQENYNNIRIMFDLMLAKNCPAHIAVLHEDYESLCKYQEEIGHKDKGGRTPLHLACSWGQRHPSLHFFKKEDEWFLGRKLNLVIKDSRQHNKILNFLITQDRCNPLEKDNLLEWSCLDYVDNTLSLLPLNVLIGSCKFKFESFRNFKDLRSVAFYCVLFNYEKLFENLETIYYMVAQENNQSLLQIAVNLQRGHLIDKFFTNYLYKKKIDDRNLGQQVGFALESKRLSFTPVPHQNALHLAVLTGNVQIVKKLITNGAQIDCPDANEHTALHLAVLSGNTNLTNILLDEGANVNSKDKGGNTVLHHAVASRNVVLVEKILERKAYVYKNTNDQSALDYALSNNFFEIFRIVLEKGLIEHSLDLYLFKAISLSNVEYVQFLLEHQANPNSKNQAGTSILLYAISLECTEISKILIRNNANPNGADQNGVTCLMYAVLLKNIELINLILQCQIDINSQEKNGLTALHIAAGIGSTEIIHLLLTKDIKINVKDRFGNTPLHCAAYHGNKEAYKLLIRKGANQNKKNKNGITPRLVLKNPQLYRGILQIQISKTPVRSSLNITVIFS